MRRWRTQVFEIWGEEMIWQKESSVDKYSSTRALAIGVHENIVFKNTKNKNKKNIQTYVYT